MSKADNIELTGIVVDKTRDIYTVEVKKPGSNSDNNTLKVTCTLSGKIRINYIRVLVGDQVTIEVSPYDLTRGKIIYRMK